MIPHEWFEQARQRIASHIVKTPLTYDGDRALFLKWENQQVTGSFKARGALNKVLTLEDWELATGLVAASAGNHGQGVALAGRLTGSVVEVFVPKHAAANKVDSIRGLGATVKFVDGGYQQAEAVALEYASENHKTFISPYNDGQIIAGQGTIALEILEQMATEFGGAVDTVVASWIVPTGAGGLISGCGAVLARNPARPRLIGVQPAASAFTHSLFHRHTQQGVQDSPTLADGLSGAMDADSLTLPMMREYVDDMVVVTEDAITMAIAYAWFVHGERIEGSAAVALARALEGTTEGRSSVVILTGGNIQPEVFQDIVARHGERQWQ